ncbi:MAG: efflux RND transporter periplasmic adaptor subunit [Tannerella sp.]|jgi:membrane fusion protein (multidrug efflux system)|nr:efflux RND transporter periplasmic adaptor subunit [Tannerella sp.]
MTKQVKWILAGVILLFVAGMIAYPGVKRHFRTDDAAEVVPSGARQLRRMLNINAMVMETQTLTDKTITTADIIPDEEVNLSFETSGKIVEIFFREGSHVLKGELLAKINDQPLQAQLKKLEAQIPLARDRVFRQRTLLDKDAVSQEAYEQVTTEFDKLMADIDLVKANIAQTELRAPFDGIVGLRYVSEGAYTSPGTVIARLTKISPVKIEFSIPEKYSDDIGPGAGIVFRLTGSLRDYRAEVYAVESEVTVENRSQKARAIYPNLDESIKPGRYAAIELTRAEIRNALAIPSESMIQEMGRSLVYLYRSGTAQPVEIVTGLRTESQVQVVSGLHRGDTVIVSGIMQLRTGLSVTIDNIIALP